MLHSPEFIGSRVKMVQRDFPESPSARKIRGTNEKIEQERKEALTRSKQATEKLNMPSKETELITLELMCIP